MNMLTKHNIQKAILLSVAASIISFAIQISLAGKIHTYSPDIDWEVVNTMPYSEASDYLIKNTITTSGIEVVITQIQDPIFWPTTLKSIASRAIGFFVVFLILLAWSREKHAT
jgi:hypothetical protein